MSDESMSSELSPHAQQALLARIEEDVRQHFAHKAHRLAHSLGVARTAGQLAKLYGVSNFHARAAGLLHDWEKAYSDEVVLTRARKLKVELACDLEHAIPLLHGPVAALRLPQRYPELPDEVWHAVAVHTTAEGSLSALDKVVYIADAIEPGRTAAASKKQRAMVGHASLDVLFCTSIASSIAYVAQTQRFLYPPTLTTYNEYVLKTTQGSKVVTG